jgi:hypothetical protein
VDSSFVEQVHEHFPLEVDSVSSLCDARLSPVDQNGTPKEFFPMTLSEHIRSTRIEDGAIALDIREGKMFRMNFVGSRIVELIRSQYTERQIVETIANEFSVGVATAESDVQGFLAQLEKHRFLEARTKTERHPSSR